MPRKVFRRIKESKWGISWKSLWIKHRLGTSHIPCTFDCQVHVSSPRWCSHAPGVSTKKTSKKKCVPEFPEYMNTYILLEGRKFQTFSKENYAVVLGSCCFFTKKCWTWNWTWYWWCLWSLHTLDISEL